MERGDSFNAHSTPSSLRPCSLISSTIASMKICRAGRSTNVSRIRRTSLNCSG